MATSNKAVWQAMQSHISALGYGPAQIGEPRTKVQDGMVAIIPDHGEIPESTLSGPRETHRVLLRMYKSWADEPTQDTEFALDQFRADIEADIFGQFQLGGVIAYPLPSDFGWLYDVKDVEKALYRCVDLIIGYRIDDNATFAP